MGENDKGNWNRNSAGFSRTNSSILVDTILLDAGWSVPDRIVEHGPDFLDAVYISHIHADHVFGLPRLLLWMHVNKREKPLEIATHASNLESLKNLIELSYPGFHEKLTEFVKFAGADERGGIAGRKFELVESQHSDRNFGIKLEMGKRVFYSGDGKCMHWDKIRDSDIIIHEAFFADEESDTHESAKRLIGMAENFTGKLYLTHIHPGQREKVMELAASHENMHVLEDGEVLD